MSRPWGPQDSGGVVMQRKGGGYWVLFACVIPILGLVNFVGWLASNTGGTDAPAQSFQQVVWWTTGVIGFLIGLHEGRRRYEFARGRYIAALIILVFSWVTLVAYGAGYAVGRLLSGWSPLSKLLARNQPKNLLQIATKADNPHEAVIGTLRQAPQQGGGVVGWWLNGSMPSGAWSEGPHLMTANPRNALLCIGPPGSGKSSSIVIPSVLTAPGMCVSTSMKREVVNATAHVRQALGQCWLFDPTGTEGAPPGVTMVHWSPLVGITDWDSADARGLSLAESKREEARGNGRYFVNRASGVLAVLLYAAKLSDSDMVQVHRWCSSINSDETQSAVELVLLTAAEEGDEGAEIAADQWHSLMSEVGTREFSSVISTLTDMLRAYTLTSVRRTSRNPNFDPDTFARSMDTLYITVPKERTAQLAPVVTALVEAIRFAVYNLHREREIGLVPPGPHATFVLDEATNVAPIPVPSLVSEAGGQGLHLIVGVQSLQQCVEKWGDPARDFLSMFPRKVILRGVTDPYVVETLSQAVGEYDRLMMGYSQSTSWVGGKIPMPITQQQPSWSTTRQRILSPADITNPPEGCATAFEGGMWALVQLAYFPTDQLMQTVLTKTPVRQITSERVTPVDAGPQAQHDNHEPYPGSTRKEES